MQRERDREERAGEGNQAGGGVSHRHRQIPPCLSFPAPQELSEFDKQEVTSLHIPEPGQTGGDKRPGRPMSQ